VISAGADGAIYDWSAKDFKRLGEVIVKSCSYSCAVPSADGKSIYAVGSDKTFKEISDSQIVRDLSMEDVISQVEFKRFDIQLTHDNRW